MITKSNKAATYLAAGGLLILWMLLSLASYRLLVVPRQRQFDFYPRWVGARAVLAGENPYSPQVDARIQQGIFGRRQASDEVVQEFVYSATITWLLLPFWILPFPLAVSLWCGLQLLLLLICPLLVMALLKWKLPPLSFFILLLFSVFLFRYPVNAYVLGQFIAWVLACTVIAWWGMANENPAVSILGMAGMLVRPEVVIAPIGALLIHNWKEKGRTVLIGWAGVVVALWLLTRLWIGPWELDFLNEIDAYRGYSFISWLPVSLGNIWVGSLLTLCVLAWGAWMWWRLRSLPEGERLPWEIAVSVLVTLLVSPQPNTYTLTLALIPIWVGLWSSRGRPVDWLPFLVVLISPWGFYLLRDSLPFALERHLIPFAVGVLLTLQWRRRLSGIQERPRQA